MGNSGGGKKGHFIKFKKISMNNVNFKSSIMSEKESFVGFFLSFVLIYLFLDVIYSQWFQKQSDINNMRPWFLGVCNFQGVLHSPAASSLFCIDIQDTHVRTLLLREDVIRFGLESDSFGFFSWYWHLI